MNDLNVLRTFNIVGLLASLTGFVMILLIMSGAVSSKWTMPTAIGCMLFMLPSLFTRKALIKATRESKEPTE